jgi:hypothetical protein
MLQTFGEGIARFFLWLFAVLYIEKLFYPMGRVMVMTLTLGRFPPPSPSQRVREMISLVPLVVAIIGVTIWIS